MRNLVVYTLMFSAMIQFFMAAYAWGRKNEPAAKPLILVFLLGGVWAFAYGMDMASSDLQTKMLWMKVSWAAASFGPLIFLSIVVEHLELMHLRSWKILAALSVPSLMLNVLVWTIPHQDLLMHSFVVEYIGELDILQKSYGILHTPIFLVLQGITLLTYYLLIRSFSGSSQIKRQQSFAILIALFIPFLANIPTILNIKAVRGFDFTPHSLVLSSALFAFAIFHYRWLDIIPLAHSTLVETIPVGVIVTDVKNRIVDINPFARNLLQLKDPIIGQEARTVFARFDPILHAQLDKSIFTREITVEVVQGQPRHIEVHKISLLSPQGVFNGCILTLQNITESKRASERLQSQLNEIATLHNRLREQAIRDPLTGLFNRRHMSEFLERETHRSERHQHPLAILMIEVDNFKNFNDTYGHDAGDMILKKIAELIQTTTRTDDVPCRFGGDEFILILPETSLEAASQCAERLRQSAADLDLSYDGKPLRKLTLSIGVACYPEHGGTMTTALRAADIAMYHAKQTGKNRVMTAVS